MQVKGKVKRIGEIETFASGFQKREMVIVTEDQYPSPISIEFLKDKGDLLDGLKENDSVTVSINLGGREWTSPTGEVKYFNQITGWKIEKGEVATRETPKKKVEPQELLDDDEDGTLPF